MSTKPLMVFEMANNHMGDLGHGLATIRALREACTGFEADFDFLQAPVPGSGHLHPRLGARARRREVREAL